MKDNFVGYWILSFYFVHRLIASIVSNEKFSVTLSEFPSKQKVAFLLMLPRYSPFLWHSAFLLYVLVWSSLHLSYLEFVKIRGYVDCF